MTRSGPPLEPPLQKTLVDMHFCCHRRTSLCIVYCLSVIRKCPGFWPVIVSPPVHLLVIVATRGPGRKFKTLTRPVFGHNIAINVLEQNYAPCWFQLTSGTGYTDISIRVWARLVPGVIFLLRANGRTYVATEARKLPNKDVPDKSRKHICIHDSRGRQF